MVTSLVIGRFQPFHKGHVHVIKYVYKRSDRIIIGIGSALESHTARNPFTAGERLEMILLGLEEQGLNLGKFLIIPIPDAPFHRQWTSIVETLTPPFDVVYSNEPLTRTLFLEAGYRVESIPFINRRVYSGEEFRRRVLEGGDWKEIVTPKIANFLLKHGLIMRIKNLSLSDKVR